MSINQNTINGKWLEIKGDLQKAWGKLTDCELDKTKGDIKAIGGLLQQRYGDSQDSYQRKISEIMDRFEAKKDETVHGIKKALKK